MVISKVLLCDFITTFHIMTTLFWLHMKLRIEIFLVQVTVPQNDYGDSVVVDKVLKGVFVRCKQTGIFASEEVYC